MSFYSRLVNDKGDIRKVSTLEHVQHVSVKVGLGHLDTDEEHPDVVEGELAVVASKHVQLSLYNVGCVPTAGSGSVVTRCDLFPMILLDVEDVHIVHPVGPVVPTEVIDLGVDQAASGRHPCAGLRA